MARPELPLAAELVYFLHAEGTDLVKIGWTRDFPYRLAELQTACPHQLFLLGVHEGPRQLEAYYHKDLAAYRQKGEWFFLTKEVRRWLSRSLGAKNRALRFAYLYRLAKSPERIAEIEDQLQMEDSINE